MKNWIDKAIAYLDKSLGKVPTELNEIDWKEDLSPKNDKLCQHARWWFFGIWNK